MVIKILGNLPRVSKAHRVNQVKMASKVFPVHQVRTGTLLISDRMVIGMLGQEILASLHKEELGLMVRPQSEALTIGPMRIKPRLKSGLMMQS